MNDITYVEGKFNKAKIFTNIVEQEAISQVEELCNQEFCTASKIRIMPDVHAGAGCTIGTTMTIRNKIVPNLVGVDIGCGMLTVHIEGKDLDVARLDEFIHQNIPAGFNIRNSAHIYNNFIDLSKLYCAKYCNLERAKLSLGTLGGGNHFIEANKDKEGNIYIVVHSGSRHLGLEIANYYQNKGYEALSEPKYNEIQQVVDTLKAEERQKEIKAAIDKIKATRQLKIPKALAYVEGDLFDEYIHDMRIAQDFADYNRRAIMTDIMEGLELHVAELFTTIHNYIDTDNMILRKGAVSARKGEKLLIPINMRDGSLICIGKGNEDWNLSAPHGAGRLMSRTAAKEKFSVSEFASQMKGIYTTSVNQSTLDECPMAYKDMDSIVNNITPTVELVDIIKPIYNFKSA